MASIPTSEESKKEPGTEVRDIGQKITRYRLVTVLGYVGLLKFTSYEAAGIEPFVANNPLTS